LPYRDDELLGDELLGDAGADLVDVIVVDGVVTIVVGIGVSVEPLRRRRGGGIRSGVAWLTASSR